MTETKKIAAVMAAVTSYLEEEALACQPVEAPLAQPEAAAPAAPVNLWGLNGRQTTMQIRNLMQLRSFR